MSLQCTQDFCIGIQDNPCTISGAFDFTVQNQCAATDKSSSIVHILGSTTGIVTDVGYVISLDSGNAAADAIDLIPGDGAPTPDVVLPGVNPGTRLFHATPDRPFTGTITMVVSGQTGCPVFRLTKPISLISDSGTYASLNADTGIFLGVKGAGHLGTDTWRAIDELVGFGPALFYDILINKTSSAFPGDPGRPKDTWQLYVDLVERIPGFPPTDVVRWFAVYQKANWPGCDTPIGNYGLVSSVFIHSVPDDEATWLAAYPSIATPAASVTVSS